VPLQPGRSGTLRSDVPLGSPSGAWAGRRPTLQRPRSAF
jgi:hypothetical protein